MPVYEQTYHHYTGVFRPRSQCWMVITQNGIKQTWRSKWTRFLLIFCNINSIAFLGRIYLSANADLMLWLGIPAPVIADFFEINQSTYFEFLMMQFFSCFLLTLFVGSDLIASDRRTKAIALYLSKPVTRLDYVLGKGMVVMVYLYAITLIPALLMLFLQAVFTDNFMYIFQNIPLILKVFVYSHLIVVPITLVILAVSSINKSFAAASVIFAVVYFLPSILGEFLENIARETSMNLETIESWQAIMSLQQMWMQLGAVIFQHPDTTITTHWLWPLMALGVVCLISAVILRKQIRAVDIVK